MTIKGNAFQVYQQLTDLLCKTNDNNLPKKEYL